MNKVFVRFYNLTALKKESLNEAQEPHSYYRKTAIINSTINEIQLLRQQQEQQQRSLPRRGHNSHNSVQQMLSTQRFHPYGS